MSIFVVPRTGAMLRYSELDMDGIELSKHSTNGTSEP